MAAALQLAVVLAVAFFLARPVGWYLANLFSLGRMPLDPAFDPIDNAIYRLLRVDPELEMTWADYARALVTTNLLMALVAFLLLKLQVFLPLNPTSAPMPAATLTLNTAISFITNTNWQAYSGETALSYFSQMAVVTFLMFTSAATGLSAAAAFIRGLATGEGATVGNFYRDFVRSTTRLLLPLSGLMALVLVAQGVPQTLIGPANVRTLEGVVQAIPRGPIASLESIKHLGTNGGGFFAANSSHPFENPTPLTNVLEVLAMLLIPVGIVNAFGRMVGDKRQGWTIFAVMAVLFVLALGAVVGFEQAGTPLYGKAGVFTGATSLQSGGNMEGKEVRFGAVGSALFGVTTTGATTGSINSQHDSYTPLGGAVLLGEMLLNAVFGADGAGLLNMLLFVIIAVFIAGLMVGRTPEFLGKKIEAKEVKLATLAILAHPLLVLVATSIAVSVPAARAALGNAGPHGLTEILYAYASASANNGSAFGGLDASIPFFNVSTALVIFLGRYIPLIVQLAVAGSLVAKKKVPTTSGTMRTDTPLFVSVILGTIFIVGVLTFFGALALGPIAEQLALRVGGLF